MNIFLKKKILIYGLGKSGLAAFKFLKNKNDVLLYDDFKIKIKNPNIKKKIIKKKDVINFNFDQIILSPGIDINKCKLSKFLKKNSKKVFSDLDVFVSFYKNDCITITGTNGKSTSCQLLYNVLKDQKFNVKLVGNIGKPILLSKKFNKKTIFIIEASSYQLEYSKIFWSRYAVILNISPDHLERHKTIKKYVSAKFKLIRSQNKGCFAFVKKEDYLINNELKKSKFKSRIIKVDTLKKNKFLSNINNEYFSTNANMENFLFIYAISKILKLKKNLLKKTTEKFKGLKYRQQIIFKKNRLKIINDSKSTSFSSSIGVLKANTNIYWLLGGVYKQGDKLNLQKKYFKNIKAFIYGKNKKYFIKNLKNRINYENFNDLKSAIKRVLKLTKKEKKIHQTIIFSPSAASFDSFKNFEERGAYFNLLIRRYLNG